MGLDFKQLLNKVNLTLELRNEYKQDSFISEILHVCYYMSPPKYFPAEILGTAKKVLM